MKKLYSYLVLALIIIGQAYAQNTVSQQVVPVFNGQFVSSSNKPIMSSEKALNTKFLKYDIYELDISALNNFIQLNNTSDKKESSFAISLGEKYHWEMSITPYEIRSKNYVLRESTPSGVIEHPRSEVFTYKGALTNGEENEVRLSFRNGYVSGFIIDNGRELFIEPLTRFNKSAANNQFVVYETADLVDQHVSCEAYGEEGHMELFHQEKQEKKSPINNKGNKKACEEAEIALACDHTFFQAQGSSVYQAENEMIETLFLTDAMYAPLDIRYKLVEIYIDLNNAITGAGTTNNTTILNNFVAWGPGGFINTHDVGSYWTDRDICGSDCNVVGTARIAAICDNDRYNIIEHYTNSQGLLKIDQAHELGHNWSAQHVSGTDFVMLPTLSSGNLNWSTTSNNSITNHKNSRTCLSSASPCPVATTVPDFSAHSVSSCDGTIAFSDLSTGNTYRWLWNFGDGSGLTLVKNPVHTYTQNGSYNVNLRVYDANGSHIENKTAYITVSKPAGPTGTDGTRCGAGSVTLSASGTNTIRWYDAVTGGNLLGTGPTYTTPSISSNTTYYAEDADVKPIINVGPANTGTGGNFTSDYRRMFFDVFAPVTLKSVKVNASGSGNRTIVIYNSNNDVVHEKTVNIPNGTSRVTLDFFLAPGTDYYIKLVGNVNLYRDNAGVSYPYTSPGLLSIKSSDAGSPLNFYYFFYDWELQEPGCISERTAVQGLIDVCSSIDENNLRNAIKIHPNPVKNLLYVDASNTNNVVSIEVFNVLGERIYSTSENIVKKHTINFQHQSSGIYYVKISSDNESFTEKVIVAR